MRKIVAWHNFRPCWRFGPYFWVTEMRGKMTIPTGKSAKARLTISALVAERSFLFITTANITKPFPRKSKCLMTSGSKQSPVKIYYQINYKLVVNYDEVFEENVISLRVKYTSESFSERS